MHVDICLCLCLCVWGGEQLPQSDADGITVEAWVRPLRRVAAQPWAVRHAAARVGLAIGDEGPGCDHDLHGGDLAPPNGSALHGTYCNVRNFSIPAGWLVRVAPWGGGRLPGAGVLRVIADFIVIDGALDATGAGYDGGGPAATPGGPGEAGRSPAPRGGGGGGAGSASAGSGGAGAGGSHKTAGVAFGGASGGTPYGGPLVPVPFPGAGGGSGGAGTGATPGENGGAGGAGGGIVVLRAAGEFRVAGRIVADGARGGDGGRGRGAGGGGAGGTVRGCAVDVCVCLCVCARTRACGETGVGSRVFVWQPAAQVLLLGYGAALPNAHISVRGGAGGGGGGGAGGDGWLRVGPVHNASDTDGVLAGIVAVLDGCNAEENVHDRSFSEPTVGDWMHVAAVVDAAGGATSYVNLEASDYDAPCKDWFRWVEIAVRDFIGLM